MLEADAERLPRIVRIAGVRDRLEEHVEQEVWIARHDLEHLAVEKTCGRGSEQLLVRGAHRSAPLIDDDIVGGRVDDPLDELGERLVGAFLLR